MNNIITIDSIRDGISKETGILLKNNNFFLSKLYDGFLTNAWQLKTPEKQKSALYSVASSMAKCAAAGIDFDKDFDLLTPVFRGGIPTITIDIKALPRILQRKGWIYQDAMYAIPKDGHGQFEETIANGKRIVIFNHNGDIQPVININNIVTETIERFAIRISVGRTPSDMIDFFDYVPTPEIIAASNASEAGIYEVKWESYKDEWGKDKKRRIIVEENGEKKLSRKDSPWNQFTSTMVKKVCIRRLQATIKETFPEIAEVMENLSESEPNNEMVPVNKIVDIPSNEHQSYDFNNITPLQAELAKEAMESYRRDPNRLLTDIENIYKEMPNIDENTSNEEKESIKHSVLQRHFITLYIAKRQKSLMEKYPMLINVIKWLWED